MDRACAHPFVRLVFNDCGNLVLRRMGSGCEQDSACWRKYFRVLDRHLRHIFRNIGRSSADSLADAPGISHENLVSRKISGRPLGRPDSLK